MLSNIPMGEIFLRGAMKNHKIIRPLEPQNYMRRKVQNNC